MMSIQDIQAICRKLPGVTEDIKWGDHLCFNVGGKMFLVTSPDQVPVSASLKVTDENFELLTDREGIIPAPYMAKHKWVFLDDIKRFSKKQWEQYIPEAHRLIGSRLTGKMQRQLGLVVDTFRTSKAAKNFPKKKGKK